MKILFETPKYPPNFLTAQGFDRTIAVEFFSREDLKPYVKLWEKAFWANYNRRKKLAMQK